MSNITLAQAGAIIDVALATSREKALAPMTVVVLDSGGHLVAAKREDNSGILRYEIAFAKAWGGLGFGFGSRGLAKRAANAPMFITAVSAVSDGRVVPVPGGVLIRSPEGVVLGAVGISGDMSDADEACAIQGIEAVGLTADPGA